MDTDADKEQSKDTMNILFSQSLNLEDYDRYITLLSSASLDEFVLGNQEESIFV